MRTRSLLATMFVVGNIAVPAWAADLTKIDRTIAKEPAYESKPKYCLLVFGPAAKTRVWLVLDGDVLYVDRNGNGDVTEAAAVTKARITLACTDPQEWGVVPAVVEILVIAKRTPMTP